ncbi:Iron-sulfur cluster-binding protein [Nitrincola lacisaponensis]|uniref:Iron-sulfur cluster-binding protein n=1 Tax=Nitrincola lacisaponensis TaxID=267850 RepID=A0A063XZA7_9GAMM|nr:4Fe-4S dicluster domain-containing protein [Nitrincola lacisaponensis]KDE38814.1 Iron-sulfur cluster-binding protein [Nitrincola lacisaponensis]
MPDQHLHQTLPLAFSSASAAASLGWAAERCISSAPNHLQCERCVDSCPAQALFFVEENQHSAKGQRLVVSDACHGCGACLPSCPTEALLSLELQRLEDKPLAVACHRVETGRLTTESLHCLRAIGVDQLLSWMAQTPDVSITLCVAQDCTDCQAAPAQPSKPDVWWEQMQALGVLQEVTPCRAYQAAEGAIMSRRRFMGVRGPQSPVYAGDDTGVRARRLQRYTAALPATPLAAGGMPFPSIQLDQSCCDTSGVCSKICPTDALALTDEGVLNFSPLECIGCGFCISYCPEQALSLGQDESSETRVLRKTAEVTCFECSRQFRTSQVNTGEPAVCPACQRDKGLFKGSFSQLFG